MAIRYISVVDLLSVKESKEILMGEDEEAFKSLLWDIGFDVDCYFGLEYQVCYHHPMVNKLFGKPPVYTGRFVAMERMDDEWYSSGHMSEETRREILFRKDPEYVKQLEQLSYVHNWTAAIIEQVKGNWMFTKEGKENDELRRDSDINP